MLAVPLLLRLSILFDGKMTGNTAGKRRRNVAIMFTYVASKLIVMKQSYYCHTLDRSPQENEEQNHAVLERPE